MFHLVTCGGKNTFSRWYMKLNVHKKHIWTHFVVNVVVLFVLHDNIYSNLGFEIVFGQSKIIEEDWINKYFYCLILVVVVSWSSYFIHVTKKHYVHAGRLGNLTLEKKSQILANGTMQQLSYGNSVCYFLETQNTWSCSNNSSWPLFIDNLF